MVFPFYFLMPISGSRCCSVMGGNLGCALGNAMTGRPRCLMRRREFSQALIDRPDRMTDPLELRWLLMLCLMC
jgi:hypothetical protein